MKFPSLYIKNFLAISEATISLADRGLTLIQGINNDDSSADSNGAGKSSIADALCWCLYGVTARGVAGDDVINQKAGKDTIVTVMIEDGADSYRITRHRKHKTGKNQLQAFKLVPSATGAMSEQALTKGTDKLTQEVVDKILGSSLEVFKSSICAGQEQMPDLPAMTDKNLKSLLEEASGATVLEAAYDEARKRVLKAKEKVTDTEHAIAAAQRQLATVENLEQTVISSRDDWAKNHKVRVDAEKAELRKWIDEVQQLKQQVDVDAVATLEKEIQEQQDRITASAGERKQLADLQSAMADAQAEEAALKRNLADAQKAKAKCEVELQAVKHQIGCPCGECGRPLTENELQSATEAAQKRLDAVEQQITLLTQQIASASASVTKAQQERDEFHSKMTDVTQVAELQRKTQETLSEAKNKQVVLKSKAENARAVSDKIKQIMAEVNPHEKTLTDVRAQKNAIKAQLEKAELENIAATYELDAESAAAAVFSPSGVRAVILDEITPELNKQTAKYLSTLSDGNITAIWTTLVRNSKGELREKFSIEVENDKGAKTFAGLSGGEKRKVRLATALALQDLVATRAIKPIDLFIGDEIDDALDPAGLERLTEILEEKANDRGTVLIISHNDLQDSIPNIIQIEKQPGGNTVVREIAA